MDAKKYFFSLAIAIVICICCCCETQILADTKTINQQKPVTQSLKSSQNARLRAALIDKAVYQQLQQTVDLSALTLHTTFREAIDIVSNSIEPSLKVVVMWKNLRDNANIEQDTEILIDGVSGIKLHAGLDILLRAVSSDYAKLGYIVKDGIIIIATKDSLPVKMQTRVYDISDLVAMPARFGFVPGFGGNRQAGAYTGRRGQFHTGPAGGRVTYNSSNQASAARGTIALWGQQSTGRSSAGLSNLIRNTVRPNRWR